MYTEKKAKECLQAIKVFQDSYNSDSVVVYKTFNVDNISFGVVGIEDEVILAFSGINQIEDLFFLTDYQIRKRSEGGIISSVRSFYSRIKLIIDHLFQEYKITLVTGYSLGAVIATYSAYYQAVRQIDVPFEVYLFGSPRSGDENFSNSYDDLLRAQTYRVSTEGDVITHLPLYGWHVGQSIQYTQKGYKTDGWDYSLPFWMILSLVYFLF